MTGLIEAPERLLLDIADRLIDRVGKYEGDRDSRCVFAYCYSLMTRQIARVLSSSEFDDPVWVVNLALAFSRRYMSALDAYDESGRDALSPAWRAVFEASSRRYTSVLEDLIFGLTAHITADLPHALDDVWQTDAPQVNRLADYDRMNRVLGNAIESIREEIGARYAPYLLWLDKLEARHARWLTDYGIRLSRAAAWYNAERLRDAALTEDAERSIQRSVVLVVEETTSPPIPFAGGVLRLLRIVAALCRQWPRQPLQPVELEKATERVTMSLQRKMTLQAARKS